jgi:alpha-amylase/alpha-mannosidase (GH57 family)
MNRFVCVHGHFYQPPRENPWTGRVEREDSAAPFHDWNERINSECYAANAAAGNFARMSFNFGPTLLCWLEREAAEVYASVLSADRESQSRFSGHGSAIAQGHSHVILPLANSRDKRTQVRWGIVDFQRRFGRQPEGLWLPETAVDSETLECLAEQGMRFTILAPRQLRAWRRIGEENWREVREGEADTRRPYRVTLPSGRGISIFFYDGALSNAVAFGELALGGESLARRLESELPESALPQLLSVATDGETYGHHFQGGDRVLAEALTTMAAGGRTRLTNFGEFLEANPPDFEAEIVENTSWSCAHGVGRWREECGCATGEHPGWSQAWRAPLRQALDWLRDHLTARFEEAASALFRDPWAARDESLPVLSGGAPQEIEEFFRTQALRALSDDERRTAVSRLEMQRFAMLMFASCGWFFDDPAGLETRQLLRFAARAIELSGPGADSLEEEFLSRLQTVASNDPAAGDGRQIYETSVNSVNRELPVSNRQLV